MSEIAAILSGGAYDEKVIEDKENGLYVHRDMIRSLIAEYSLGKLSLEQAESAVRDRVNIVCKNILVNTAVFKETAAGNAGFIGFLQACGATVSK